MNDDIKDALEEFAEIEDAESENRKAWIDDMEFAMLSKQWPDAVKKKRDKEGRPCHTINRLPSFIRQVTNDARMNKPSIVCHPVGDGATKQTALILNGLVRNIQYTSNADVAYDTALEHAVGGGFGYLRVTSDYACDDSFDQDLMIERVANPLSIYGDPTSTAADSADWNVAYVIDLYTPEQFKAKWPKAEKIDFSSSDLSDKQRDWLQEKQIRVAERWKRKEVPGKLLKLANGIVIGEEAYKGEVTMFAVVGERATKRYKVTQQIINGVEVLETNAWQGRYIPIVPVYGTEVIVEGKRTLKSLIRDAKDAQQAFNYWRTASTELVALAPKAPWVGPRGFADGTPEKWATANSEPHQYLEYDGPTPPIRQGFDGPPAAALQEAANAQDDMKSIMGIFDASLGAKSNETSGRAIMARQKEGDTSTFNYVDNLSRALRHVGRILVDMIPHVYTSERIIRVIHEDGTNEPVPVNQPIPGPGPMPGIPRYQQDQQEMQEGMARIFDLTAGKYDVTCEVGPSFNTKREEAATQMTEFIRSFPASAPLIGDLVAKNLDWPGSDEIAARLKAMLPPQIQGENPQAAALQQQMQTMDQQAREAIGQMQGELQKLQQQLVEATTKEQAAQLDKQIDMKKTEIDAYEAITKRMQAGLDLYQGASQEMLPAVEQAQGQVVQAEAKRQHEETVAMAQSQAQMVAQAVAALAQAAEKLAEPRPVQRNESGQLTHV